MARGRSRLRVAVRALAKVRERTSVMWHSSNTYIASTAYLACRRCGSTGIAERIARPTGVTDGFTVRVRMAILTTTSSGSHLQATFGVILRRLFGR